MGPLAAQPRSTWQGLAITAASFLVTLFTLWTFFVAPIEARVTRIESDRKDMEAVLQRIEDKLDAVSVMVERLDERTTVKP